MNEYFFFNELLLHTLIGCVSDWKTRLEFHTFVCDINDQNIKQGEGGQQETWIPHFRVRLSQSMISDQKEELHPTFDHHPKSDLRSERNVEHDITF